MQGHTHVHRPTPRKAMETPGASRGGGSRAMGKTDSNTKNANGFFPKRGAFGFFLSSHARPRPHPAASTCARMSTKGMVMRSARVMGPEGLTYPSPLLIVPPFPAQPERGAVRCGFIRRSAASLFEAEEGCVSVSDAKRSQKNGRENVSPPHREVAGLLSKNKISNWNEFPVLKEKKSEKTTTTKEQRFHGGVAKEGTFRRSCHIPLHRFVRFPAATSRSPRLESRGGNCESSLFFSRNSKKHKIISETLPPLLQRTVVRARCIVSTGRGHRADFLDEGFDALDVYVVLSEGGEGERVRGRQCFEKCDVR